MFNYEMIPIGDTAEERIVEKEIKVMPRRVYQLVTTHFIYYALISFTTFPIFYFLPFIIFNPNMKVEMALNGLSV